MNKLIELGGRTLVGCLAIFNFVKDLEEPNTAYWVLVILICFWIANPYFGGKDE